MVNHLLNINLWELKMFTTDILLSLTKGSHSLWIIDNQFDKQEDLIKHYPDIFLS